MLAVAVLILLTFTLFRFVSANLDAIRFSTSLADERQSVIGLVNLVQGQLNDLPPKGQALLTGQAHKFKNRASDEMQWRSKAGVGVLTSSAPEEYRVTLMLRPQTKTSPLLDLGLKRRPIDGTDKDEQWLPLIPDFAALEVRYFDPRVNAWLERWNDQNFRPLLVRLRLWRTGSEAPYEAILNVPAALTQQ
jgi:hypothetical protein